MSAEVNMPMISKVSAAQDVLTDISGLRENASTIRVIPNRAGIFLTHMIMIVTLKARQNIVATAKAICSGTAKNVWIRVKEFHATHLIRPKNVSVKAGMNIPANARMRLSGTVQDAGR